MEAISESKSSLAILLDERRHREKWNRRYAEKLREPESVEPNALAWDLRSVLRQAPRKRMLDAACGLGRGIAAAGDLYQQCIGVDQSEVALRGARANFKEDRHIHFIASDIKAIPWPADYFSLICAFGFTDWGFFDRIPHLLEPGGVFIYEGFSSRQLSVNPKLTKNWTATASALEALFTGWRVLRLEETDEAPFRWRFAAQKRLDGESPPPTTG